MQAFKAMYMFLDDYYDTVPSDDLGSLLGDLQLFPDGGTYDPAAWGDWLEFIKPHKNVTSITAFKAMQAYLKDYGDRISSPDVHEFLKITELPATNPYESSVWKKWEDTVEVAVAHY